ncbi:uncharacterized protein LOC111050692 [Nilaparvata lugens]|uniref:uncharacterized protein LOC111050692 n=1 Tax=Nilaparvata lugens TaxID=108931 RepID=UPI000B97D3B6|nr:uncharacterized protein LOC111050692 [Nilaparvata lugens]
MTAQERFAAYFLLLSSAPLLGEGIRCYVCNSRQDPRCLDPFQSASNSSGIGGALATVDCEQDNGVREALETVANLMTKLGQAPAHDKSDILAHSVTSTIPTSCQKIDLTLLGEKVTGRGCSVHQMEGFNPCDAVKLVMTSDVQLDYCGVCSHDGCNTAAPLLLIRPPYLLQLICLLLLLIGIIK